VPADEVAAKEVDAEAPGVAWALVAEAPGVTRSPVAGAPGVA